MHNPDANDVHGQNPDKDQKVDPAEKDKAKEHAEEHDEEQLDETIDESFPASDPPANY